MTYRASVGIISIGEMGVGVAITHSLCIGHAHSEAVQWVDLSQHFGSVGFSVVYRKGALRSPLIGTLIQELVL